MIAQEIFFLGNSYLCTYDLYGPLCDVFDARRSITRASGRGLGPGNRYFITLLGPGMAKRVPFGPK
jgi:hypothetical protein